MRTILLTLLVMLLLSGCATRKEIRQFQVEVEEIRASNARLEEKLDNIDSTLSAVSQEVSALRTESYQNSRVLEDRLDILENALREQGVRFSEITRRIERVQTTALPTIPDTSDTAASNRLFDSALLEQAKGRISSAIEGYKEYLEKFPSGPKKDRVHLNLGECYFAQKKYDLAIKEYSLVKQQFPTAMYKMALSYLAQGDKKTAKSLLNELIEKFPGSEEAAAARRKLKEL
ncbi:tetratricopeptide repeat protein [bacterium]|nr:tetratricopeptide repeat protein [bacterium]